MHPALCLRLPEPPDAALLRLVDLCRRVVSERSSASVTTGPAAPDALLLTLALDPALGPEAFSLQDGPGGLQLTAGDLPGLRYGLGRFLREARYGPGGLVPGPWRGVSRPDCPLRGMYCAFNFDNWYVSAPRAELGRYFEDLSLWGINAILLGLLLPDPADPAAFAARHEDYRHVMALARAADLQVGLLGCANCGFPAPPAETLAPDFPDTDPPRRGLVGPRVCPSHPAGREYLLRMLDLALQGYEDLGLDFLCTFPYDAGGCGCEQCWPWGARGYVELSREWSRLVRARYPECRFILPTWCFDVCEESDGEFAGLDAALRADASWVDFLMTDAHEDFPPWPLEHGAPGGVPMVNFPEITMWGRYPWGGSGANPLPARLHRLWGQARHLLSGGFPYSEGIFEDLNKALVASFYWDREADPERVVREYLTFEVGPDAVDPLAEAVTLLERTYPRETQSPAEVERAWELVQTAEARVAPWARSAWRWRILYLRALVDHELLRSGGEVTDRCDEAYEELTAIFHAQHSGGPVTPPSRRYRARRQQEEAPPPGAAL